VDHVPSQQQHDARAGGRLRLLTPVAKRGFFLAFALLACAGFAALGVWQIERRAWKLDLIARVDARIHAPAAPPPARAGWARVNARDDAYRHVRATGSFLHDRETFVQAVTERGAGFWVLTPLSTDQGTVLINRGFVPPERRDPAIRRAGQGSVTVTGLLRISEPGGAFLRSNDPAAGRWYSRDVAAIARARGVGEVAPFFIDADATPNPGGYPVGGLTVVAFPNNHLVYALTWFGLAALSAWGAALILRRARRN
jgi:surfeit locus 1 family protein